MALLITGASGYLGSHFYRLIPDEKKETVLCPSHSELNLSDPQSVTSFFSSHKIENVLHLAACLDNNDEASLFRTNVAGVYHLVQACKTAGVSYLCFTSTNNVYGTSGSGYYSETDRPNPDANNRYGISKLFGEYAVQHLLEGSGMGYSIIRIGDVYGPKQKTGALLKAVISNIVQKNPQKKYGIGDRTRDYIYVDDVVSGLSYALEHRLQGIYNLGTGIGTSVSSIISAAEELSECKDETIPVSVEHEDHSHVVLDVSKLKKQGFQAEIGFFEGLSKIVEEEMSYER